MGDRIPPLETGQRTAATGHAVPLVPGGRPSRHGGVALGAVSLLLRASLVFSPRPAVMLVRRAFAAGGSATAQQLERHAPDGVAVTRDERYGGRGDMLLDLYRPAATAGPLPLVVWVHGGGWVAGSREEISGFLNVLASEGYAVAAPDYSLAPGARYPTPLRQVMEAIRHLQEHAGRLGVDPDRVVLAGDSAGAQIAAQAAAVVTTPGYAAAVGVSATVAAEQLRGVVLACGPFDLDLLGSASTPTAARLVRAVLWAYSGRRDFDRDPAFATMSVASHLTGAFPPALVTVGSADPLRPHSDLLVERLRAAGVEPETVLFPDDHRPPLGHEYQFDLDTDAGRVFLERLLSFLERRLHP